MKILIRVYQGEDMAFLDVYPAPPDASQPQTATEREAIAPRCLGSNESLEVAGDGECESVILNLRMQGFYQDEDQIAPNTFTRLYNPRLYPPTPID